MNTKTLHGQAEEIAGRLNYRNLILQDDVAYEEVVKEIEESLRGQTKLPSMKLVYVCSPLRPIEGETFQSNVEKARGYCQFVLTQGYAPIASHILGLWDAEDDESPEIRAEALKCAVRYVEACDELWAFGPRVSAGMKEEIDTADRLGKPVRRIA